VRITRRELCRALGSIAAGILPLRGLATKNAALASSGPFGKPESMMTSPDKEAES